MDRHLVMNKWIYTKGQYNNHHFYPGSTNIPFRSILTRILGAYADSWSCWLPGESGWYWQKYDCRCRGQLELARMTKKNIEAHVWVVLFGRFTDDAFPLHWDPRSTRQLVSRIVRLTKFVSLFLYASTTQRRWPIVQTPWRCLSVNSLRKLRMLLRTCLNNIKSVFNPRPKCHLRFRTAGVSSSWNQFEFSYIHTLLPRDLIKY